MNVPEVFIPFLALGRATHIASTNYTSLAAGSSVEVLVRPSRPKRVRVAYAGYVAATRVTATGDRISTTDAGVTVEQHTAFPGTEEEVVTLHTRYFTDSLIELPQLTPISYSAPQKLTYFNNESFAIRVDEITWYLEFTENTWLKEVLPYMLGLICFYKVQR